MSWPGKQTRKKRKKEERKRTKISKMPMGSGKGLEQLMLWAFTSFAGLLEFGSPRALLDFKMSSFLIAKIQK